MVEETIKERPSSELEGLRWDIAMGKEYEALAKQAAFVHMYDSILSLRRNLVEQLIVGSSEQDDALREGIRILDSILRLPDHMVAQARESETAIRSMGLQ